MAPKNSQNLNRYTYVLNNPLSYTDPSGHFFKKLFSAFKNFFVQVLSRALITALLPGVGAFVSSFLSGFLAGAITGGSLKAGFFAGLQAGLAVKVGGLNLKGFGGFVTRTLIHGVTQGAISKLAGGRFVDGAAGAIGGSLAGKLPNFSDNVIVQTAQSAIVGGTISEISGGSFVNGAFTATFVDLYNRGIHNYDTTPQQGDIVVGFDGAGPDSLYDNQEIRTLVQKLGGKLYDAQAVTGGPVEEAAQYISKQLEMNPGARVFVLGYSAGGDAAIRLAHRLNALNIQINGLVTFDPHSPIRPFGYDNYSLPGNVLHAQNFYQHNQVRLLGGNPFLGGTLSCGNCANQALGPHVVHGNVVGTTLADSTFKARVYATLGR